MTCAQCGAELRKIAENRPEGRHGTAERDDYRCSECPAGGAVVVRRDEVVRRVGPVFEHDSTEAAASQSNQFVEEDTNDGD